MTPERPPSASLRTTITWDNMMQPREQAQRTQPQAAKQTSWLRSSSGGDQTVYTVSSRVGPQAGGFHSHRLGIQACPCGDSDGLISMEAGHPMALISQPEAANRRGCVASAQPSSRSAQEFTVGIQLQSAPASVSFQGWNTGLPVYSLGSSKGWGRRCFMHTFASSPAGQQPLRP